MSINWRAVRVFTATVIILLVIDQTQAASMETIDTSTPGSAWCTQLDGAGNHYIRMTSTDAAGNVSALSNEVMLELPAEVCWRNAEENVDGSALVDLVAVTVYYDPEPIVGLPRLPNSPATTIELSATFHESAPTAAIVQTETNEAIMVGWDVDDGPFNVEVLQWPDGTVPVAIAQLPGTSRSFSWTPTKAGVYYFRLQGQTLASTLGHVFYVKLAPPTDGGID